MTTKEATQFIMKKYEIIKSQRTKDLIEQLSQKQQEESKLKEEKINQIQKDINEITLSIMKANGFDYSYDNPVTINKYGFYGVGSQVLKEQIKRIEAEVEIERNKLIDKTMLLGVKNQSIKDILMELMEKTQD